MLKSIENRSPKGTSGRSQTIMTKPSWVEIVQENSAKHGELIVGFDPSLADIPAFFEQGDDEFWIRRFVDFVLDSIEGQVGFVKFQSAYFEACGLAGCPRCRTACGAPGKQALASF